jgi:trehalose 6-phosphate phosphatase
MTQATRHGTGVETAIEAIGNRLDASPFALMLDIDGTLAPIAPTPPLAQVPSATLFILERLASLPGVSMALVSGRSAPDARAIAGVPGAWVIGNHGHELMDPDGVVTVRPDAASHETAMAEAARQLASLQMTEGALLENKRWTLSIHYRNVKDDVATLRSRVRSVAAALGLRITEGRKVMEVRPPVDVDKGTAVLEFALRHGALPSGAALYAGDDRTDEDAFRALRASGRAVTVHIGDGSRKTSAEIVLPTPAELHDLLGWLVTRRRKAG